MVIEFPKEKLSPQGFYVNVDHREVRLPDGTVVNGKFYRIFIEISGLDFRNTFHLNPLSSANIFVPCGGKFLTLSKRMNDKDVPKVSICLMFPRCMTKIKSQDIKSS